MATWKVNDDEAVDCNEHINYYKKEIGSGNSGKIDDTSYCTNQDDDYSKTITFYDSRNEDNGFYVTVSQEIRRFIQILKQRYQQEFR